MPLALSLAQSSPAAPASYCDGAAYVFSGTTIARYDPLTGLSPVASLPMHLNAVGATTDAFYGIARGHVIRVPYPGVATGEVADLGPIHGAPPTAFAGAYVGAIDGSRWYILGQARVYTIDLTTLTVTAAMPLTAGVRIGDWVAGRDGELYSLSTLDRATALVRIDPRVGTVTTISVPAGLAAGSEYGAVWMLGDDLYAMHNRTGGVYKVGLSDPSRADLVAVWPASSGADAASCFAPAPWASPSLSPALPPALSPALSPAPTGRPQPAAVVLPQPHSAPSRPIIVAASDGDSRPGIAALPTGSPASTRPARLPFPAPPALAPKPHPINAGPVPSRAKGDLKPVRRWVAAGIAALAMGGLLTARVRRQ